MPTQYAYATVLQPPPGSIVAPNGFPADPSPKHAPQTFLDAMNIRIKVFCDEQKCAIEPELDKDDPRSFSWVVYERKAGSPETEMGRPVSTVRMVPPPHGPHPNGHANPNEEPYVRMTRVATLADARGRGINRHLVNEVLKWLAQHPQVIGNDWKGLILTHAQTVIEGMYSKMGFVTDDSLGRWDEEGIEHLGMWKKLDIDQAD